MNLTHRQAQRYLEQRLDGALPLKQQEWLQDHLRQCAACREYAERCDEFHTHLSQALPGLWPPYRASRARYARTIHKIQARRSGPRHWLAAPAHTILRLALFLVLASVVFWHFQGSGQKGAAAPEDVAFNDPAFPDPEIAAQAIAVRFDLDFNQMPGNDIELYVPVCDGVEFVPSASALFHKLNLGQPLPECSLQPSDTILLAPGATHQLLLVYRNPTRSAVQFRFEPTSHTELSAPFAQALCAGYNVPAQPCTSYDAPPRGIWAKFVTLSAPPGVRPGAHVNVTARVQWTQDAE